MLREIDLPMQNQTSLQKIRDLIRDVEEDLALIERQAKLGMLSHSEAESICTSIIQSITELNTIHLFKEDNYRAMEN